MNLSRLKWLQVPIERRYCHSLISLSHLLLISADEICCLTHRIGRYAFHLAHEASRLLLYLFIILLICAQTHWVFSSNIEQSALFFAHSIRRLSYNMSTWYPVMMVSYSSLDIVSRKWLLNLHIQHIVRNLLLNYWWLGAYSLIHAVVFALWVWWIILWENNGVFLSDILLVDDLVRIRIQRNWHSEKHWGCCRL